MNGVSRGEHPVVGPLFRTHDGQRFNDHVFAVSSDRWKVSVVTRDALCTRSDLRAEYEELKRDVATDTDDLDAYSRGKAAFVERVLETARTDENLSFDFAVPESATDQRIVPALRRTNPSPCVERSIAEHRAASVP